jgi:hypothetical protein
MSLSQKNHALISAGEKTLYALADNNGTVNLAASTNNGLNWSLAVSTALEENPTFLAYDGKWLVTASEKGVTTRYAALNVQQHIRTPDIAATEINDLSGREGIIAAATDSGIFILRSQENAWKNVSSGPLADKKQREDSVTGSILLLRSGEHSLDTGSVWKAGKCYGTLGGYLTTYYITANVVAAVDELSLERLGGETYKDVVSIQYVFSRSEGSTNITVETPRLDIYYARDIGPVLIRQYIGKTLLVEIHMD